MQYLTILLLVMSCSDPTPMSDASSDSADPVDVSRIDSPSVDLSDVMEYVDEGSDTAPDSDVLDPGWLPLPNMPSECVMEYASQPENVLSIVFRSCGEGCSVLESTTPDWNMSVAGGAVDGVGYFSVIGEDSEQRRIVVLANTDGITVGAWRGPNLGEPGVCTVSTPSIRAGYAGFVVRLYFEASGLRQERIYHSPVDQLATALGIWC